MARKPKIDRFNEKVLSKYQIYNSLFLTLPFESIKSTSVLLPLFSNHCKLQYELQNNPNYIVEKFFERFAPELSRREKYDLLFNFIKYIERQVVLFDSIEDAAFSYVNNMHGRGTVRYIKEEAQSSGKLSTLGTYINRFKVRIVLTAHPTQFYPDNILVIIHELTKAIETDDLDTIKLLLAQLGKTPFYKKEKPTPLDEAISLVWYLENVFYHSASSIYNYIEHHIFKNTPLTLDNNIFDFGFWPGGDRDGNPFVTPDSTLKTAKRLQFSIFRNYYRDLRKLRRKLTFKGMENFVSQLEQTVFSILFYPERKTSFTKAFFLNELERIRKIIIEKHSGLYENEVLDLIHKVKLFGFHFASLDIRQDSRIHSTVFNKITSHTETRKYIKNLPENYESLSTAERCEVLPSLMGDLPPSLFEDEMTRQTLESIRTIREIQQINGEKGCHRYIISNCQILENILELFAMHLISGWNTPSVDFIPLFETIPDLEAASDVIRGLFSNPEYKAHLEHRGGKQTIMLGFSDGTKDGGYLMANWSIYNAKESLSELAIQFGVKIAFFDGRGGPPARGGGNTHDFYSSMGDNIQADDIQLTVQGQTVSSNFGTVNSSQFNLEQLLSSGIFSQVLNPGTNSISEEDRNTFEVLAQKSFEAYQNFKNHPKFIPYLEHMSTLPYYSKTNIGSRPSKRGMSKELNFSDLRAIPFVGSWSQLKQNVPGFYGVGTAIQYFKEKGRLDSVKALYQSSSFFRTLVSNSMMSLTKSFFQLTAYMKDDPEFGEFWQLIYKEYELSKSLLLEISGFETLMENEPAGKASIEIRDEIVRPLLTIQQFALMRIRQLKKENADTSEEIVVLEKMVTRSLFGNINASRNSA